MLLYLEPSRNIIWLGGRSVIQIKNKTPVMANPGLIKG
jgi:hypothetical protein